MSDVSTIIADAIFGAQQTIKRATVNVVWEADPNIPGRTAYRVTGVRRESVQMMLDDFMRDAEAKGGMAEFTPPVRGPDNNYVSLGHVIIGNPGELSRRLNALGAR